MDRTIIIESAQKAADGLAQAQLWSTIIIGLIAIGVPAAFACLDRAAKATDARLRARSFALAWYEEIVHLRDYLGTNARSNREGAKVESHAAIAEALRGAKESNIPVQDLYLLGKAGEPLQRAFALIRMAESYALRRDMYGQQGKDIDQMDSDQAGQLIRAERALVRAITLIDELLK